MKFLFVILLFPLQLLAQDISGVWTGTLYNDTTKQYLEYELAINDLNGKLNGYSYTIFIIDSIKNIGVKSIKIKKKNDKFLVEDEKLIYNNYVQPAPKGVRTFSRLSYSSNDTSEILSGPFTTNPTREYSVLTGSIFLEKKIKKIKETLIVAKLDEMGLINKLSFIHPEEEKEKNRNLSSVAVNEKKPQDKNLILPAEKNKISQIENDQKSNGIVSNNNPKKETVKTAKNPAIAVNEKKPQEKNLILPAEKNKVPQIENDQKSNAVVSDNNPKKEILKTAESPAVTVKEKNLQEKKAILSPEKNKVSQIENDQKRIVKEKIAEKNSIAINEKNPGKRRKKNESDLNGQKEIRKETKVAPAGEDIAKRKIETIETVEIKQDSLVLSLFDNGVVDGDTVSILINGKVIWPRVGLLEKATNKTIYLTPDMGDSILVVMYAESLGSIPPNTGLLVVRDGEINHEIRFSGDLKKNSAIILRRMNKH